MSDVLVATDLAKKFGSLTAVDGVDFSIAEGETFGLLGPNGAGKTTSISMIAGLLEPDRGSVVVCGERITPKSTVGKAAIGLVPQDLAIYPDLTATENLRFFGRLYGLSGSALSARVSQVLDTIGLGDRAGDLTKEFSGGMRRRLNIGVGLLHEPSLLILDEPTVGVDPQSRNAILESVESLSSDGIGVLYTTHYMEEAERLCDRVAIIDEGKIRAMGTRRELVAMVGGTDRINVRGTGDLQGAANGLNDLESVTGASATEGGIEVLVEDASANLSKILTVISSDGVAIGSVEVVEPNLEAVFLHLTGRALRD